MITRIVHYGHVVENLEEAAKTYGKIFNVDHYYYLFDEENKIKIGQIWFNDSFVELLEPVGPKPVESENFFFDHRKVLEEKGSGFTHTLFRVDDLEKTMQDLRDRGLEVTEKVLPGMPKLYFLKPEATGGIIVEFATDEMIKYVPENCEKRYIK